jgi:cation transport ATPase
MFLVHLLSVYWFALGVRIFDIDACNDHASTIVKLNDDITRLNAQLKTCKDELEKIKFAWEAYTIGRHPSIKDGLGSQKGAKDKKSHEAPNSLRKRGKRLWLIVIILLMLAKTMLIFMLMLRMFEMCIIILMLIMLFILCVMMLFMLHMPWLLLLVHLLLMVRVGTMFIILYLLMCLRLGMHFMVIIFHIIHLMLHIFFIVNLVK